MDYVERVHPRVFAHTTAIPNQFTARSNQMQKRIREGMKRGYPDILVDYPVVARSASVERFHGLRIEAKRRDGYPSHVKPDQRLWIERLNAIGYCAVVAWGFDDMVRCLESYLAGEHPKPDDPFARPS